jgi:hypothetical protein
MTGLLLLTGVTTMLVIGAGAAVACLRLRDAVDRIVAFGILGAVQLTLVVIVAGGLLHRLDRPVVAALTAASAAAEVGTLLAIGPRSLARPRVELGRAARQHPWTALLALVAACVLVWRAALVLLLPPYAYDGLSYHLTAVAEWIQRRDLVADPLSLCCAHYPGNGEITFAWLQLLLGNDTLVDGAQLPFAILGAVAVAGLARHVGVRDSYAIAAGCLFFLTPIVIQQTTANYVDVIVAASSLAAIYFLVRAHEGERPLTSLALAGAAAGLAGGVKPTGIALVAVLVVLLVLHAAVLVRRGLLDPTAVLVRLVAFAAPVVVVGGYWYLRNAVDFGNPVYPFHVGVAGTTIFAGTRDVNDILTVPDGLRGEPSWKLVAHSWWSDVLFWRHGAYTYETRLGGLGPLWTWLGLPLGLATLAAAVRRRSLELLTLAAAVVVPILVLPYQWWSRFTIPLAALGAVGIAFTLSRLRSDTGRVVLMGAVTLLACAGIALSLAHVDPAGRGRVLTLSDLAKLSSKPGGDRTIGALFFPEYRWVDGVSGTATIGVQLEAPQIRFVYPLFGTNLGRHVLRLNAASAGELEREVRTERIDYLLVGRGSRYDRWARSSPSRYATVVADDAGSVVYRVSATG